ncbi:tagaturonate reductase [Serpentinicella alkaliphila]|uniref:Tagaturonate reductase n=1 Tax=Serpentinicella alkaliphila TaxID=1734049 RepID=A0A4V2T570_9FIRM|nr:tagaturonate reductase [Serpentinicella alkaliphila]QUH26818.1 tagaturonate reductase [Serpentinicella alkaliphila]TCQ08044.1 tagaturonate reductase [Serpentinicella alkaliphila]
MQLNKSIYKDYLEYPERILQFGEGNFLRAFVDWIVDKMNKELDFNTGVLVVGPLNNDKVYELNDQSGLYTLLIKGIENRKLINESTIINSITRAINTYRDYDEYLKAAESPEMRFIISNTTEAGIVYDNKDKLEDRPQNSFPGKLTAFLYHRYKSFNGDLSKGLIILPCELIDKNGEKLKDIIIKLSQQWKLESGFIDWINNANVFYNTLVDRIVPGYPTETADEIEKELGYRDKFLVEGEYFHLWVIEGPKELAKEFPAHKIGLNVLFVDDLTLYRTRKVRILNGLHTIMVPVSYLYNIDTVKDSINDEVIGGYIRSALYDEIVPTLDLPQDELNEFAAAVIDRFRNPYIKHFLISISLNSMSKFETRVLPSILEYNKRKGELPRKLLFSLAALIRFYKGERNGEKINLSDSPDYLQMFSKLWENCDGTDEYYKYMVEIVLGLEELWKMDLNKIDGLKVLVSRYLINIEKKGIEEAIREIL